MVISNERVEQFTMANQYPVPILGQHTPVGTPSASTDWVKVATSSSSAAVNLTGMKAGQLWEFRFLDAGSPNSASSVTIYYRPYDGTNAAATSDAFIHGNEILERRILAGPTDDPQQVGYSFKPITGDIIVCAVRKV